MKKYVSLLLLLAMSAKGFSQNNNANTTKYKIQEADVIGSNNEPKHQESKSNNPKDCPSRESINLNCIVGDYWSSNPIVEITKQGENESRQPELTEYKLFNDSTFKRAIGHRYGSKGRYELDSLAKTISFDISDSYWRNMRGNDAMEEMPLKIKILNITDSTVTLIPVAKSKSKAKMKSITMYRHPNCVPTQQWEWEDGCDGKYSLLLTDDGLFEYWANQSVKVSDIDEYLFQGQYHLHNDVLYLSVQKIVAGYIDKSKGTRVMTFGEGRNTYVRINLEEGLIHSTDLDALHNADVASRGWQYKDCKYKTDFRITYLADDEWMEMTKVKEKEEED